MNEKQLKEWNKLYDRVFRPIRRKHDAVCELFGQWNVSKIDTETAITKLKALIETWEKEKL